MQGRSESRWRVIAHRRGGREARLARGPSYKNQEVAEAFILSRKRSNILWAFLILDFDVIVNINHCITINHALKLSFIQFHSQLCLIQFLE